MPLITCVMAMIFCFYNGFSQSHTAIYVSKYNIADLYSPNFILGKYLSLKTDQVSTLGMNSMSTHNIFSNRISYRCIAVYRWATNKHRFRQ